MSIIAARLASLADVSSSSPLADRAKALLAKIVLPKRITREVIHRYIRKAFRTGAWRTLSPEARALLLLSSRILTEVRSRTLASLIRRILIEIELFTFRGRALFTGIILALQSSVTRITELLRDVTRILFLGISYLNNPLMYRAHV